MPWKFSLFWEILLWRVKQPPEQPESEGSGWQRSANLTFASEEELLDVQANKIPESNAI